MTEQSINNELITELITTIENLSQKIDDITKINQELLNKVISLEQAIIPQKNSPLSKYIDKVFYINLDKRTDRKEEIEKELTEYKLDYERFPAVEISYYGCLGCSYSHHNAIALAKERGYKNILILEDDFTFVISSEQFEKQMETFFNSNVNYDVCLFSYNLQEYSESNYNFLYKVKYAQTTSGYLVNEKYYDTLINNYREGLEQLGASWKAWIYAIDVYWKELQEKDNWYCFKEKIGIQKPGFSDIRNDHVEFNC
jgi:hypothetical protein